MNHWFTSDTHYNHKAIVRGISEWSSKKRCRDFDTMEEHNKALVEGINSLVKADDILYHLGDWSFGGFPSIREFREKLNCKHIHLVFGNHDHHLENNKENIRALFSSVGYYKHLTIAKQEIILSHYAMRVWNRSHHGSWMLYGHSHGTLDEFTPTIVNPTWIGDEYFIKNFRTMDVGVDTNGLKPYSLEELHTIMDKRPIMLGVDHHAADTN